MLEKMPKCGNNPNGIPTAAQQLKIKDKKDTSSSSDEHAQAYNESENDAWKPPEEESESQQETTTCKTNKLDTQTYNDTC